MLLFLVLASSELPCFLFQRKPLRGHLEVPLCIGQGLLLQPFTKALLALGRDVLPNGTINQGAAVALGGNLVEHSYCGSRQNDVDTLIHRRDFWLMILKVVYTHIVWMSKDSA